MAQPSVTGSDTFRLRLQRSEFARAGLMCAVYAAMTLLTLVRRLAGGVVMADESVFAPYLGVLVVALSYSAFVAWALRAALRENRLVTGWRLTANAAFELAVPALLQLITHLWSPRGEYTALSAPPLLLYPLTILLSVLRLRPPTTLWLGIGAALIHACLVLSTIRAAQLEPNQYPVLFSYALLLALTGVAGMLVSRAARHYVAEAVAEAEARQRTALRLAGVERDLEVARQIQTGLLPAGPPRFPGFEIAGMNRPADQTGGDYYDWQELPNGRLLVVMADVTGHGIGPALVMAVCRAYARASAPLDMNPITLMSRLNALLHADVTGGRFVTLAMVVLDADGHAELVSAGHGPTLLFRAAENRVEQFGGDGLPLAIVPEETYGPIRAITMQRDDVLVLLTDGVHEWHNSAGEQFGITRVTETLAKAAVHPAQQIVEGLDRAARDFSGGAPQTDDVTVVVIKRTA